MAKLRCYCDTIIQTSGGIPNELEWKIISDIEFDRFAGMVNAEEIYSACKSAFRCPTCDRLWIFWRDMEHPPRCYTPEALDEIGEVDE
ncbi:hypothetical protein [Actinocrinis sp.]|uniref:hypothetical protein n=1 Tax=Actinocrinis sp. TaxID=1920516 RepID=UPI002D782BA4|nr:hypothetical protein [Actinocrinis sp.]